MSAPTFEDYLSAFHKTGMVCDPRGFCIFAMGDINPHPCGCAIGAALLDRLGPEVYEARMELDDADSVELFAEEFNLSLDYAHGVSNGFSNPSGDLDDIWSQFAPGDLYAEGLIMGERVRAAVQADTTIPKYEGDEEDEEDEE